MKPRITALIDTYNHERFIEQAIVSVVEQGLSSSELEIVVVDDGSTDNTSSIIRKFVPRVKHLRKKNGGQASAFNAGFLAAQGDCVALLDGDDWWAKGKLAATIDALENSPGVGAVSHAYYEVREKENQTRILGPSETEVLRLDTPQAARLAREHWHFLLPCALTVRRKVIEQFMPIPENLVFSADAPIATAAMAAGVLVLPQPLAYYRIHSGNLNTGTGPHDMIKLRRKLDMDVAMLNALYPLLTRLGVPSESISALLDPVCIYVNGMILQFFGGSRLQTFRTEMRSFHSMFKQPRIGYLIYKYLVVGTATLVLPPRTFYKLREWVGRQDLQRFRHWASKRRSI